MFSMIHDSIDEKPRLREGKCGHMLEFPQFQLCRGFFIAGRFLACAACGRCSCHWGKGVAELVDDKRRVFAEEIVIIMDTVMW